MHTTSEANSATLIDECRRRSVALLRQNLAAAGIMAAAPTEASAQRGYTAVFARDAAICALGMAVSGDSELERHASTGLLSIAAHQAANGQLPKFVDTVHAEPDFWYLGCIDSGLWWLIAIAYLDRRRPELQLRAQQQKVIASTLQWLLAQEHQKFFLLQQNEASDWADIMPRSGFVLYTNALWHWVKRLYDLPRQRDTKKNFNHLLHPFSADLVEYRRGKLLADYALNHARNRDLYLSFVNFSFFGEEGDVFGNILALLTGAADAKGIRRTLSALSERQISSPYPVRSVCDPILEDDSLWRAYMSRHRQNFAWQYHNGGIWPMIGGFWIVALLIDGAREAAGTELVKLAQACALNDWEFNEWLHGQTGVPAGMPRQSWNAAAFLMADHALRTGEHPFR